MRKVIPKNEEIKFAQNEIIVSKTDMSGKIVYANDVFCRVAEMQTAEVIGQPHNIIRHPDMPRAVFKLLWDTLQVGEEIFAYIKNMSATGKYYWVIAHVTPSKNEAGNITGYHSNRRFPNAAGIADILPLYQQMKQIEESNSSRKSGLEESYAMFEAKLDQLGKSYDEFIWETGT